MKGYGVVDGFIYTLNN